MKALMLVGAVLASVGCQSEPPPAVRVPAPKMSTGPGSPSPGPVDPTADMPEPVTTTTTEAPPPTTTTPPPEPITCPGYEHPLHHLSCAAAERSVSHIRRPAPNEPPSPQSRSVRPASGGTPPDYVKQCESGGSYTAVNPNGHYGAWQFSQSTWESVGGSGRPDQASPAEQDRRAAILWDGGSGASHWECA